MDLDRHDSEIHENKARWDRKPLLRAIYRRFHERIAAELDRSIPGAVAELGSGIGSIRDVIPDCICTDLFPNPWLDQVESAYALSFADGSMSNVILFDVFHHLRYPGTALAELRRVLAPGGRVILFEPYVSAFGALVYGPLHAEPIGWGEEITWSAPPGFSPSDDSYYAAQGNATRIFFRGEHPAGIGGFRIVTAERFAATSYVASGGYSKMQLYPASALPLAARVDAWLDRWPRLFATRALVVLAKL